MSERQDRITQIKLILEKANISEEKKAIAKIALAFGLTERKVKEIINLLANADIIELKDAKIYWKGEETEPKSDKSEPKTEEI